MVLSKGLNCKKLSIIFVFLLAIASGAAANINDFDREKPIEVTDESDADAEIDKVQPVYLTCGDEDNTGTGDVEIDCGNVDSEEDIAFYDENSELLDYELESFDSSDGGVAWVYKSDWTRDNSKQLKLAYGDNADETDNQDAEATWDSADAEMVQHLEEDPLSGTDSTNNDNDGTVEGASYTSNGQFNGAANFNGEDDYIEYPETNTISGTSQWTTSLYFNADEIPSDDSDEINYMWHPRGEVDVGIAIIGDGTVYDDADENQIAFTVYDGDETEYIDSDVTVDENEWYEVAVTNDGNGEYELFVDGESKRTESLPTPEDADDENVFGGQPTIENERSFEGTIDEAEIFNTQQNSEWAQADYEASDEGGKTFFSQAAAQEAEGEFEGGSGSEDDPYEIATCDQLQKMEEDLGAHYELVDNVDCKETEDWEEDEFTQRMGDFGNSDGDTFETSYDPVDEIQGATDSDTGEEVDVELTDSDFGEIELQEDTEGYVILDYKTEDKFNNGFEPVGREPVNEERFDGSLDGNYHAIENLYIDNKIHPTGLFGTNYGEVRDLGIVNADIQGDITFDSESLEIYMGTVAGEVGGFDGLIDGVYVSGEAETFDDYLGGIVGFQGSDDSVTRNSYSTMELDGASGDQGYTGGLTGYLGGTIEDSYSASEMRFDSDANKGPITGNQGGEIKDSVYWDYDRKDFDQDYEASDDDSTELSTDEMQGDSAEDNMDNLDFDDTWSTVTNYEDLGIDGYPTLFDTEEDYNEKRQFEAIGLYDNFNLQGVDDPDKSISYSVEGDNEFEDVASGASFPEGMMRVGEDGDGAPVFLSYFVGTDEEYSDIGIVWKQRGDGSIERIDEFDLNEELSFDNIRKSYRFEDERFGDGSDYLVWDSEKLYEVDYDSSEEEITESEFADNVEDVAVNPEDRHVTVRRDSDDNILDVYDFDGSDERTVDLDDADAPSLNDVTSSTVFWDEEEDLWVTIRETDPDDDDEDELEWTIGDENGPLRDDIIDKDLELPVTGINIFEDYRIKVGGALIEYVEADTEDDSNRDIREFSVSDDSLYTSGEVDYQDLNRNIGTKALGVNDIKEEDEDEEDKLALIDFDNKMSAYEDVETFDAGFDNVETGVHSFYSVTQDLEWPEFNSMFISPSIIDFNDDFDVEYDVTDPNGGEITRVSATIDDPDYDEIVTVDKEYSSETVDDKITREDFEDEADTEDLFEEEDDYQIEVEAENTAGETSSEFETLEISSEFELSEPESNVIKDGEPEPADEIIAPDSFQGTMDYVNGAPEAEGDIYLNPVDGWNESEEELEDDEWYSDDEVKELTEDEGTIETPESEIKKEFPFEKTDGEFEMVGLGNVDDSVPDIVTEDEFSDFDAESDVKTFEVRFNRDNEINLSKPENESVLTGKQEVDFEWNVTDPDGIENDVELILKPNKTEEEEVIYNTTEELPENEIETFEHTEELDVDNYEWRVETEKNEEVYESETFEFEIDKTFTQKIIDGTVKPLGGIWRSLLSELGTTGSAFFGVILVLLMSGIGYGLAGRGGGELFMILGFLVATITGLFPGWLMVLLAIATAGYFVFLKDGER